MPDKEKTIEGIVAIREFFGFGLPSQSPTFEAYQRILTDALVLLKEQEIGHWILLENCSNSGVYCSECNTKVFNSYPFKKKFSYFCPHCGTRMEGEIERR